MSISRAALEALEEKYQGFSRLAEILLLLKLCASTWYKYQNAGNFPPSIPITGGVKGYQLLHVKALMEFINRHGMPRGENQWPSMLERGLELLAKKL